MDRNTYYNLSIYESWIQLLFSYMLDEYFFTYDENFILGAHAYIALGKNISFISQCLMNVSRWFYCALSILTLHSYTEPKFFANSFFCSGNALIITWENFNSLRETRLGSFFISRYQVYWGLKMFYLKQYQTYITHMHSIFGGS